MYFFCFICLLINLVAIGLSQVNFYTLVLLVSQLPLSYLILQRKSFIQIPGLLSYVFHLPLQYMVLKPSEIIGITVHRAKRNGKVMGCSPAIFSQAYYFICFNQQACFFLYFSVCLFSPHVLGCCLVAHQGFRVIFSVLIVSFYILLYSALIIHRIFLGNNIDCDQLFLGFILGQRLGCNLIT